MNILVTGSNGFIGGYLANYFHTSSHSVVGTCRGKSSNSVPFKVAAGLELRSKDAWSSVLSGQDCVIHCAAVPAASGNGKNTVEQLHEVNVDGTIQLAKQAERAGVSKFVFISSVKVYGDTARSDKPFSEQDLPNPTDSYGGSKWEAEQALSEFARHSAMDVVVVRLPMVYGPYGQGNFSSLIRLARTGLPLPFRGVENKRSLVFIGNVADFIGRVLARNDIGDQTFLIADQETPSTEEIITVIRRCCGMPARLFPLPESFIRLMAGVVGKQAIAERLFGSFVVDTENAWQQLGWRAPMSFSEGVRRSMDEL